MKTFLSILVLVICGIAATSLMAWITTVAGFPGALIAGTPGKRTKRRFIFGSIVSAIGQSYVYLAYSAMVVSWTIAAARREDIIGFLLWPFAGLAVLLPIYFILISARVKAKESDHAIAQAEALHITFLVTLLSFFLFAFVPTLMNRAWDWVPYVATSSNAKTIGEAFNNNRQDNNGQAYANDKTAFLQSLALFIKAQKGVYEYIDNYKKGYYRDAGEALRNYDAAYEKYKAVIEESQKVSDEFLDSLHTEFRSMYRDRFIACIKIIYESALKKDDSHAYEIDKEVNEKLESFWAYFTSVQDDIVEKYPDTKETFKKLMSE